MGSLNVLGVGAVLLLLLAACPGAAESEDCLIAFARLPATAPRFSDFPAEGAFHGKSAPADLKGGGATREFRTRLREGAAAGPNFAGHYTVVSWGCGGGCGDWAIIDAQSGKVHFAATLRDVSLASVAPEEDEFLRFTRDSALLAVLGAPNEDEARDGVAFLRWDGASLKPVVFFPRAAVCRK